MKKTICIECLVYWYFLMGTQFLLHHLNQRSYTCPLASFFWLLSHVIYLKLNKSIIQESSFSIWQNLNFWMIKFTVTVLYQKKNYLQNLVNLIIQKFARLKSKHFSHFSHKSERIESIHFAESSGLTCWETEKEDLLSITQIWVRRRSHHTLVSLR